MQSSFLILPLPFMFCSGFSEIKLLSCSLHLVTHIETIIVRCMITHRHTRTFHYTDGARLPLQHQHTHLWEPMGLLNDSARSAT